MANRLYNHKRKIKGIQPAKLKALEPGMLITFRYNAKDIMDKNPLIIFLYRDINDNLIDGLNLNYLTEYKVSQLFKNFNNIVGVTAKDEEDNNLLNEDYTLINLPSYKKVLGGNPLSKSESIAKMKRLYEKVIKPKMLKTDNIYRSYKISNIRTLKVVRYDV
tara:strand:- start:1406 stop:1891 length:486 start_codon:yes stop_codon:yes gene_type:complete